MANLSVETARSRAQGLTQLIIMDIADAFDMDPTELDEEWRVYAEAFATGVFVTGEVNRIAHVGLLSYVASQLP